MMCEKQHTLWRYIIWLTVAKRATSTLVHTSRPVATHLPVGHTARHSVFLTLKYDLAVHVVFGIADTKLGELFLRYLTEFILSETLGHVWMKRDKIDEWLDVHTR